jgi:hypothetical protein
MGEVRDTVSGPGPKKVDKKKKVAGGNLIAQMEELREEVSRCTEIKDEDVLKEGDDEKAENLRKAGLLRAVHSLLTSSQRLLEEY